MGGGFVCLLVFIWPSSLYSVTILNFQCTCERAQVASTVFLPVHHSSSISRMTVLWLLPLSGLSRLKPGITTSSHGPSSSFKGKQSHPIPVLKALGSIPSLSGKTLSPYKALCKLAPAPHPKPYLFSFHPLLIYFLFLLCLPSHTGFCLDPHRGSSSPALTPGQLLPVDEHWHAASSPPSRTCFWTFSCLSLHCKLHPNLTLRSYTPPSYCTSYHQMAAR